MQISFYQLKTEPIDKTLPVIMEKIMAVKGRAVILCADKKNIEDVDRYLWSVGGTRFLPHGNEDEGFKADQPIYLTTKQECPNGAKFLVVLNGEKVDFSNDFFNGFERTIDIFDGNNEDATKEARSRFSEYKKAGKELKFFKQEENGKWIEG